MASDVINAAVIGLGVGAHHAVGLLRDVRVNLTSIAELDVQKFSAFAAQYPQTSLRHVTADNIVADKDIDLLSIASFDEMHFDQVMAGLANGKHIFVEKPLCQTIEQLRTIYQAWSRSGLGLSSNLLLRESPLYAWLRGFIAQGELGEIYAFDGDYLYGRLPKITEGWRSETENYSVMDGGGIHIIDLMIGLCGALPTHVQAAANKIVTREMAFRYFDFHSAAFTFSSGLIGRVTANFGCVHKHQHVIRIFGTKGTFIYDDMGARLHRGRDHEQSVEMITLPPRPADKSVLLPGFIDDIQSRNVQARGQREFDLMSVVLAADAALSYNQPLEIGYLSC